MPIIPFSMGSNSSEVKLHDRLSDWYSSGVFAFRTKGWYPALHSAGASNSLGTPIERRVHSFAIATLKPSDDGDWVSAYATTSVTWSTSSASFS